MTRRLRAWRRAWRVLWHGPDEHVREAERRAREAIGAARRKIQSSFPPCSAHERQVQ